MFFVGERKINKTISVWRLQFFGLLSVSKNKVEECYLENGLG